MMRDFANQLDFILSTFGEDVRAAEITRKWFSLLKLF